MGEPAQMNLGKKAETVGVAYATAAFLLWGILPLFWKLLDQVQAFEILMHRVVWSFVVSVVLIHQQKKWRGLVKQFGEGKKMLGVSAAAVLLGINWGIYIWSVNTNHVVDASLGYYINPILSVCLGMLILRERLTRSQIGALCLALSGVLLITFQYGRIPWMALLIAGTFGTYGLLKKMIDLDSTISFTLETVVLLPIALCYLFYLQVGGHSSFEPSLPILLLLMASGVVTSVPLIWFAKAAQLIPLSTLGFIQYLTPTMMLIIGVFINKEPFTVGRLVGFILIWSALALFSFSQLSQTRKAKETVISM